MRLKKSICPARYPARATSKGGALYRNEDWDLVDRLKKDAKFDVKKVPVAELSDELKKMTPEQREKHVRDLLSKREGLQKQIAVIDKRSAVARNEIWSISQRVLAADDFSVAESNTKDPESRRVQVAGRGSGLSGRLQRQFPLMLSCPE